MEDNWIMVYSSEFVYVVELARGILEQHDIKSIVLNKMDSMHTHLINAPIELYVSTENEIQARHYLSKMKL